MSRRPVPGRSVRLIDRGTSGAPDAPWIARSATSSGTVRAKAHSTETTVNVASAIVYTRTVPKRLARNEVAGSIAASASRYPETVHCTLDSVPCKDFARSGIATLTTLLSTMDRSGPASRASMATGPGRRPGALTTTAGAWASPRRG